eukprot:492000-Amphidinium_carterae.1
MRREVVVLGEVDDIASLSTDCYGGTVKLRRHLGVVGTLEVPPFVERGFASEEEEEGRELLLKNGEARGRG